MVHIVSPFAMDKNLGKSYNETIALLPDNDWACLIDMDCMFLTADAGNILNGYAERFPGAALMTCYTNRVSPLSKEQLLTGVVSTITDIKYHINLAEKQKLKLWQATEIKGSISGMLMLISKKAWKEQPFSEDGKCLGVDTAYSRQLFEAGKKVLRMEGLYVWHTYRLVNGIGNKKHLL